MKISNYWPWITRNVEETVKKWVLTSCSVVLIRGHRRCGKSSTVVKVCKGLGLIPIIIYVKSNEYELIQEFSIKLNCAPMKNPFEIIGPLLTSIKQGNIIIVEEIQNCSDSFQVVLQQVCDTMAYEFMENYQEWNQSGALFLMGSLPGMVDTMIESRKHPLFQRIHAKITIYSFDTSEIVKLYSHFSISDGSLMLSLHSLFGGKPFPYVIANKANLLKGNKTEIQELVKEFFAPELQQDFQDALQHFELQLGTSFAAAVKALKEKKTKADQITKIKDDLQVKDHEAYSILFYDLYQRYGIIKPVYSFRDLQALKIECFQISDPVTTLASIVHLHQPQLKRENVIRELMIPEDTFEMLEGFHFEAWIREIAEDRYLLKRENPFPFLTTNDACCFLPSVKWDLSEKNAKAGVNVEIDIVASQPSTNTLILGSCKRSYTKISQEGLLAHWELLNDKKYSQEKVAMFKYLKLKDHDQVKVVFAHFVPKIPENTVKSLKKDYYVVSLADMLAPFYENEPSLGSNQDDLVQPPIIVDGSTSSERKINKPSVEPSLFIARLIVIPVIGFLFSHFILSPK